MVQTTMGDVSDDLPGQAVERADLAAGRALASRRDHPIVKCLGQLGEIGDQGPLYEIGASVTSRGFSGEMGVWGWLASQ